MRNGMLAKQFFLSFLFSYKVKTLFQYFNACRYLYWTAVGQNPKLVRSYLDGTNQTTLVASGLSAPKGITVDIATNDVYWCDAVLDTIQVRCCHSN